MLKNIHYLLIFISCLASLNSWAQTSKSLAFILFDAGETLAFTPAMNVLRSKGIEFKILPMSTSRTLLKDCKECLDLKRDCAVETIIDSKTSHTIMPFTEQELESIETCLNPSLAIFGAPSMAQYQIAEKFHRRQIETKAYFDALSPVIRYSIGHMFLSLVDEFWVPSTLIANAAELLPHTAIIKSVGQPTLEIWEAAFKNESRTTIIESITGYQAGKRTLLFAGGYGLGYRESVIALYESAEDLVDTQILISAHPRMGDALERELLKNYPSLTVLFIPPSIGTMKALIVSDLLISQNSTTGIQALFVGKPSVYIDPLKTGYSNFVIDNGWSKIFESSKELTAYLSAKQPPVQTEADPYQSAGIPRDSALLMAQLIEKSLSTPQ